MNNSRDAPPRWWATEDGQTPLDPDETAGLRLAFVATRGDLDAAEANNIAAGLVWAERTALSLAGVANESFLRTLHGRLFGQVWDWAGTYRSTERNIGIDPAQIRVALKQLFDDVEAWRTYGSYTIDEQALRLHHRLTWIHPFPNGNGRTSRAMADLYLKAAGEPALTWGAGCGLPADAIRARYLAAVRAADGHDLAPLIAFARS